MVRLTASAEATAVKKPDTTLTGAYKGTGPRPASTADPLLRLAARITFKPDRPPKIGVLTPIRYRNGRAHARTRARQ
jgi:hypothetical protein